MPRRARIHLADLPLHIVQRGHNRDACFFADEDYHAYLHWLGEVRIPRDSATDSTMIRPPAPRSSGRVSRSEATQGFQVKVLSCRLSIFLFPCAWFFRSS